MSMSEPTPIHDELVVRDDIKRAWATFSYQPAAYDGEYAVAELDDVRMSVWVPVGIGAVSGGIVGSLVGIVLGLWL